MRFRHGVKLEFPLGGHVRFKFERTKDMGKKYADMGGGYPYVLTISTKESDDEPDAFVVGVVLDENEAKELAKVVQDVFLVDAM